MLWHRCFYNGLWLVFIHHHMAWFRYIFMLFVINTHPSRFCSVDWSVVPFDLMEKLKREKLLSWAINSIIDFMQLWNRRYTSTHTLKNHYPYDDYDDFWYRGHNLSTSRYIFITYIKNRSASIQNMRLYRREKRRWIIRPNRGGW